MSELSKDEIRMMIENATAPKTKVKKPRKPMSAEHKAKALEALKKAREASKLARGKKAQAKKIIKSKKEEETDDIIRKSLLEKTTKSDAKDKEIERLQKKLDGLTLQDVIPKIKKVSFKEPLPKIEETEDDIGVTEHSIEQENVILHIPMSMPKSEPEPIPIPLPEPIATEPPRIRRKLRGRTNTRY